MEFGDVAVLAECSASSDKTLVRSQHHIRLCGATYRVPGLRGGDRTFRVILDYIIVYCFVVDVVFKLWYMART